MTDTERYLPRHLIPELEDALASARVVNLIGPRQVGKTTLVRDLFGNGRFITLDDAAVLAAIEADPDCLLYTSPSPRDLSTSRMPSSA